jgi:hypothetical protein
VESLWSKNEQFEFARQHEVLDPLNERIFVTLNNGKKRQIIPLYRNPNVAPGHYRIFCGPRYKIVEPATLQPAPTPADAAIYQQE